MTGDLGQYPNRATYELVDNDFKPTLFSSQNTLASWEFGISKLSSDSKPGVVWNCLKEGKVIVCPGFPSHIRSLGIEIDLFGDVAHVKAAGVVKPLVDGVIAGFHVHDGNDAIELAQRVGDQVCVDAQMVLNRLMEDTNAVLGSRRLLHRFGKNVQWNPADDCLVYLRFNLKPSSGPRRCAGSLYYYS